MQMLLHADVNSLNWGRNVENSSELDGKTCHIPNEEIPAKAEKLTVSRVVDLALIGLTRTTGP